MERLSEPVASAILRYFACLFARSASVSCSQDLIAPGGEGEREEDGLDEEEQEHPPGKAATVDVAGVEPVAS